MATTASMLRSALMFVSVLSMVRAHVSVTHRSTSRFDRRAMAFVSTASLKLGRGHDIQARCPRMSAFHSSPLVRTPCHGQDLSPGTSLIRRSEGALQNCFPFSIRKGISLQASLNRFHNFDISAAKVEQLFDKIDALEIDVQQDIEEKFIRGSGAGGQKINKTSLNVQMRHLPTGLQVTCQREREREKNRFLALRQLVEKIEAQRGGGPTKADKALEKKRKQKARRKRKSSAKKKAASTANSESEETTDDETTEDENDSSYAEVVDRDGASRS